MCMVLGVGTCLEGLVGGGSCVRGCGCGYTSGGGGGRRVCAWS